MVRDKVKLRKLIDFISDIGSLQGNDWFVRELLCKISEKEAHKITGKTINEVHEYCIKDVIRKQAEGFYSEFKIAEIKQRLIDIYVEMEVQWREDNFVLFFVSIYRQVELIVNHLYYQKELQGFLDGNCVQPALLAYDYQIKNHKIKHNGPRIKDVTWHGTTPKPTFKSKFRAVLYFYYYKKELNDSAYYDVNLFGRKQLSDFNKIFNTLEKIHIARNIVHEGSAQDGIGLSDIEELIANRVRYYSRFIGFLEDFMTTINKNL